MTVMLPPEIERLAERRAAEAGCASVADYLSRLVKADAETDEHLVGALMEGLDESGDREWSLEAARRQLREEAARG